MNLLILSLSVLLLFTSCREQIYIYKQDPKIAARLFHVAPDVMISVFCRINQRTSDSFFAPPDIDPYYTVVGVVRLDDAYQLTSMDGMQVKEIEVSPSLSNASVKDWQTCPEWSKKMKKDDVKGEIYYSPSLHALYFEVGSYLD